MPPRFTALLLAVLALFVVAACGGDDEGDFEDEFPTLSQGIASLGEDVGSAIEDADQSTDRDLAREFDSFAAELGDLRQQLEDLEPPEELADEREELVSAMSAVRASLAQIGHAAEERDPEAAREATLALVERSGDLREARASLARAVREGE